MSYTISIAKDSKYIFIDVKGPLYTETAMEYTVKSHQLGKQKGIQKYLVDLTESTNMETPVSNFNFAESDLPATPEIDRRAKVAFLVKEDDHSHDFVETLIINRGHKVRIFRDLPSALEFLEIE